MVTPFTSIHLEVTTSTQDEARSRLRDEPVLVTAAHQTAGRGRTGARWENAPRALAASLACRPDWPVDQVSRLTLVAGLAACEVVGPSWGLKWPNDLVRTPVAAGTENTVGKAGGIITERFDAVVVVGFGVNLWWPEAPVGRTALHDEDPGPEAVAALGERWAAALLRRIGAGPEAWGRDDYRDRCTTIGAEITWEPDGRGRAIDVSPDGGLVVETAGRRVVLTSGVVQTVRSVAEPGSLP